MIQLLIDLIAERRQRRLMKSLGIRRVSVPTLGTQISGTPVDEPDYSQAFRDWGWTR